MKERNNIVVFKRALIFTTIAIFFFLLGTTRHFYSQGVELFTMEDIE